MIDTLKIVEILEKEMDEPKARAVARAIDEAVKESSGDTVERLERKLVTKDEFYTTLRDLEVRLLRWSFGFWVTAIAAIVAARWMR